MSITQPPVVQAASTSAQTEVVLMNVKPAAVRLIKRPRVIITVLMPAKRTTPTVWA